MPLIPAIPQHCSVPMEIVEAKLLCDKCHRHEQSLQLPLDEQQLIPNWPFHCEEFLSLRRRLRCHLCGQEEQQHLPHGRAPLDYLPGSRDKRVFVGGNYDLIGSIRDVKAAVLNVGVGFHPILPYDDYQIPPGQVYDSDLRLLHNCRYAIFEVTLPAGELFEIARCAEYKVSTLLVYQARGFAEAPPRARTMLLESGQHEHRSYRDARHLAEIVRDFLLDKDPAGWRLAVEGAGYHIEELGGRLQIHWDGTADHEFSYTRVSVDIPEFLLAQVPHTFLVSSGEIVDFEAPDEQRISWRETSSGLRSRVGVVRFAPPLRQDEQISYMFKMRTKGAFILRKEDLKKLSVEELDDPLLAAGLEYTSRDVVKPIGSLNLSVRFPEGYPVSPQPSAYFGAEQRSDGLRIPPDAFTFEDGVAELAVRKPRMNYRYCIVWDIPEVATPEPEH